MTFKHLRSPAITIQSWQICALLILEWFWLNCYVMLKRSSVFHLSSFSLLSAGLYCIPVIFFLKDKKFSESWLLFLGNALFLFCIFILAAIYSRKNNNDQKKFNGFTITFTGVILSCIMILLLALVYVPDVYHAGFSNTVLRQSPPTIPHGLLFMILANALIGNFCAGTFATIIAKSAAEKENLPS